MDWPPESHACRAGNDTAQRMVGRCGQSGNDPRAPAKERDLSQDDDLESRRLAGPNAQNDQLQQLMTQNVAHDTSTRRPPLTSDAAKTVASPIPIVVASDCTPVTLLLGCVEVGTRSDPGPTRSDWCQLIGRG